MSEYPNVTILYPMKRGLKELISRHAQRQKRGYNPLPDEKGTESYTDYDNDATDGSVTILYPMKRGLKDPHPIGIRRYGMVLQSFTR